MQIVRAYLELEQCRLASRLDVQIEVDDAALQIPIPALSIQPLVENAVKHGVALRIEPGYVRIKAQCRNEELRISVENSASGRATEAPVTGVGLQNVRRRLEICYGAGAELRFSPGMECTTVEIRIPLVSVG
jgi:LytS/YehU family sensor histidine kinase